MRDREPPSPLENQAIGSIENQLAYRSEEKYPRCKKSFGTSVIVLHICA